MNEDIRLALSDIEQIDDAVPLMRRRLRDSLQQLLGTLGFIAMFFPQASQIAVPSVGILNLLLQPSTSSLLEKYFNDLNTKLDQDRISKLLGAWTLLREGRKDDLSHANASFHQIVQLPQHGKTGGYPNGKLRCLAFIGMVAIYLIREDNRPAKKFEKIYLAAKADNSTAEEFFGEENIHYIVTQVERILVRQQ